ncbi:unnamed protein product [Brachionus calyciflorus]|uniref:Uncharacterized protein n=1 Tax=Brachionus calyciflorus TaxID=104777 RepID=A0A814RIQ0_9BILA|nr:unnamed protein product [Brachionus calyciflorus]
MKLIHSFYKKILKFEWSKQWLMDFSEEKCVVMHYGSSNNNYEYFLNNHKLTESNQEKDLGVVFTKDLKIRHTLQLRREKLIMHPVLLNVHLNIVTSSLLKSFIHHLLDLILSSRYKATKIIGEVRNLKYEDRLIKQNLTTLEERRLRGDLIKQFKIVKNLDQIEWHYPLDQLSSRYDTMSHNFGFEKQLVRNCSQRFSFFIKSNGKCLEYSTKRNY